MEAETGDLTSLSQLAKEIKEELDRLVSVME